jgi:hypothetical protein
MGFIQQSTTKKIYAYLTQFAKGKILDGNEEDFTVKYFSLHDTDVNYNISANIVNNSYNTLPSGFIPDITGDNQGCLFSIANGVQIENTIEQPPQPTSLVGTVVGSCTLDSKYQINVTNIQGGTGEGYFWYVKTDVISFTSATSTNVAEAIILSTTTSDDYAVGTPQSFNATFNFADTYLPREADSYNFTVYAKDSSGIEVEIKKFTDINCSKRTFGVVPNFPGEPLDLHPSYPLLDLITQNDLETIPNISTNKTSFALFVVDNGNRRRDLNLTDADRLAYDVDGDSIYIATTDSDTNIALSNAYRLEFNGIGYNDSSGYHSQSLLREGAIVRPSEAKSLWIEQLYFNIPDTKRDSITQIINGTTNFNYDILHPTVKPFNDMVSKGFNISYIELALKSDPQTGSDGTSVFTIEYDGDGYTFLTVGLPNEQIGNWLYSEISFIWGG